MANKYKLVYNAGNKVIKGSLTGIPTAANDTEIIDLKDYADTDIKKVYEKKVDSVSGIYISTTGVVNANDIKVLDRAALEGVVNEETPGNDGE